MKVATWRGGTRFTIDETPEPVPGPGHALVAGNPARRIGWVCACGARLLDGNGNPAPAEIERYATNPELSCERCHRRYRYEADEDTLREVAR